LGDRTDHMTLNVFLMQGLRKITGFRDLDALSSPPTHLKSEHGERNDVPQNESYTGTIRKPFLFGLKSFRPQSVYVAHHFSESMQPSIEKKARRRQKKERIKSERNNSSNKTHERKSGG